MSDWIMIIENAKKLLDMGAITQEQFEQIRDDALASRSESTAPPSPPPNIDDMGTSVYTGEVTPPAPPSALDEMGTFVGKMDGDVVGSHKIIELLGEGGMGSVYRGRHTIEAFAEAEGDVAIKMILPSLAKDEAFRNRFIREASLGKKLNHPNIAKVVSIHSSDDVLALVMEYIEGKELKDLIPKGGMSVDDVVRLLKPIASALDYLHKEGIVHRDMKPANVRVKPDGTPVILDFGIAKDTNEVDSNMTQTGTAMGTQTYMAPEQMDAKRVTGAADQYALAMMAYQMLSGELPWDSGVSQARLGMIKLTSDYQTLIAICSVSEPQNDAVMKGLSLQPEDRYETCVVFVETLDSAPSVEQLKREAEAERLAEQQRLRAKQETEHLEQERLVEERQKQERLERERQRNAEKKRLQRETERQAEEARRETERQIKASQLEAQRLVEEARLEAECLDEETQLKAETEDEVVADVDDCIVDLDSLSTNGLNNQPDEFESNHANDAGLSMQSKGGLNWLSIAGVLLCGSVAWLFQDHLMQTGNSSDTALIEEGTTEFPIGKGPTQIDLDGGTSNKLIFKTSSKYGLLISLKQKGLEYDWNGKGEMILTNVPGGKIRATVLVKGKNDLRTQIFISEEQTSKECTYELTLGNAEWSTSCIDYQDPNVPPDTINQTVGKDGETPP